MRLLLFVWLTYLQNVGITGVPTIVQSFSSRFGLILGGYGPGNREIQTVDLVLHDRVCPGAVSDVPSSLSRFLGDVSGLAEYVDNSVVFCRHSFCWKLNLINNTWSQADYLQHEREHAASAEVGDRVVVVGGKAGTDLTGSMEIYQAGLDKWEVRPDLNLAQPRYSFCAVSVNTSAVMVIGGWGEQGALDTIEVLDIDREGGTWEAGPALPAPSYGHACVRTEVGGREGILVTGGALTGREVRFLDLGTGEWESLPPLAHRTDGHKLLLIEGIPTSFSWENIEQFDGSKWTLQEFRLPNSRSAFAAVSVPGHLVKNC